METAFYFREKNMTEVKNISRRVIALLLTLTFMISLFGCSNNTEKDNAADDSLKSTVTIDGPSITVKDMLGREVEIPADTINNTVGATYGVATPFFVTLNLSDRVLACNYKNGQFIKMVDETVYNARDIGNEALDVEKLATIKPSVYICKGKPQDYDKIAGATTLNIPTLTISAENPDEVIYVYEMLGKAFGVEERAKVLINYLKTELQNIDNLASTIPEERKVTALCMGSELGRVAGDDMLQTIMLKKVGAKTVVDDVKKDRWWVNIGVEEIFNRNPDCLFVTSSGVRDYSAEQLYSDPAWNAVTAVQNRRVYVIPALKDSWDMPGPAFILAMYYMMHCMYPDVVNAEYMQYKTDEFYQLFYGRTLSGEEIGYQFY